MISSCQSVILSLSKQEKKFNFHVSRHAFEHAITGCYYTLYDLRIDFTGDPNNHENIYGPIYKNNTADMNKINKSLR